MITVVKKNGTKVDFDAKKIVSAIVKANGATPEHQRIGADKNGRYNQKIADAWIEAISEEIIANIEDEASVTTADIQNMVETKLMTFAPMVARTYMDYRHTQELREAAFKTVKSSMDIVELKNDEVKDENSNKNPVIVSVQRDYMAGEVSKSITNEVLLPVEISKAHKDGIIHFHDTDYFAQHMHNCDLIDLAGMWNWGPQHGQKITTMLSGHGIETPKSFLIAANQATQFVAQVASCQYGGQTFTMTDFVGGRHDADINFVDVSRQKLISDIKKENAEDGIEMTEEQVRARAEKRLYKEIKQGIQTIQYQLITLQTTNGQAPFVTVFMYLNECVAKDPQKKEDLALLIKLMLEQRIKGVQDEKGNWITPAFPKLIYVLQEDNIEEGSKYWDLTVLAAKCTAKRMVPDYISEKKMKELKGDVYPCMGCRSFLTPDTEGLGENGEHKYYGRFNQGVITINLVDIALSSGGDEKKFWEIFEDRMENLVHKGLRLRHERLLGTTSDVAPILWQSGALARLAPGEKIDKLLYGNYSTISVGYAGLYECVKYMKNVSHTTEEGKAFGLKVMQFMNDKCADWRAAENISYSVYGTPLESTTYKFASKLKERFGVIEGVTDHDYVTNSYHINVREEIDAFSKLTKEAEFQKLSPGGAISYVETPNMENNIDAVLAIMKHIYNTILYAELNSKSDICEECGYTGEIQIREDEKSGKLYWQCPQCGCTDQTKMHVARRTCGYIGTQYWNQGRTQEIRDRVIHLATKTRSAC
ncbi:MAG: anaerobic ribonucleoside-triphosphate reductase [Butyrivibrio sp.]|uniref:anaerobic ribonucleoside-triphosphate reductase n=1 Tax=Butyrivibrio sp. TaxID=28121 RepID=UPI001B4B990B|nr:anaerobic ribonucleoside-triphosphate reductase [Butyrivibrio sp.]MBP3784570.1 anaerobic ribonucleoside-triphosphate reductase [Butyrivibrio sp.]